MIICRYGFIVQPLLKFFLDPSLVDWCSTITHLDSWVDSSTLHRCYHSHLHAQCSRQCKQAGNELCVAAALLSISARLLPFRLLLLLDRGHCTHYGRRRLHYTRSRPSSIIDAKLAAFHSAIKGSSKST
jgi:hypothetical protein